MLALAPQRVRRDMIDPAAQRADSEAIAALIFDRGASFPGAPTNRAWPQAA